ncbi:hypothetical protein P7K49_003420, partial [Saguinus oedipus]
MSTPYLALVWDPGNCGKQQKMETDTQVSSSAVGSGERGQKNLDTGTDTKQDTSPSSQKNTSRCRSPRPFIRSPGICEPPRSGGFRARSDDVTLRLANPIRPQPGGAGASRVRHQPSGQSRPAAPCSSTRSSPLRFPSGSVPALLAG